MAGPPSPKRAHTLDDVAPPVALEINKDELLDIRLLGAGGNGQVQLVFHPAFGNVAWKKLNSFFLPPDINRTNEIFRTMELEDRELRFTSQLDNHPNILKFLAYVVDERQRRCGMLLEYMDGGSVASVLHNNNINTLPRVKQWFIQLARAVYYCHHFHGVMHRDIKIENALLCDDFNHLKLCDFGFTRTIANGGLTNTPVSLFCTAPETIDSRTYGLECDVWSFGMFIYSTTHAKYPFYAGYDQKNESFISISIPFKYRGRLEASDRSVQLTSNPSMFKAFLEEYDKPDGHRAGGYPRDFFRPEIEREKLVEFYLAPYLSLPKHFIDIVYQPQVEFDVDLFIAIMKSCWQTNPGHRKTMEELVSIMDFHFNSQLELINKNGRCFLENKGPYNLAVHIVYPDERESYVIAMSRSSNNSNSIDLCYLPVEQGFHIFRIKYMILQDLKGDINLKTEFGNRQGKDILDVNSCIGSLNIILETM